MTASADATESAARRSTDPVGRSAYGPNVPGILTLPPALLYGVYVSAIGMIVLLEAVTSAGRVANQ